MPCGNFCDTMWEHLRNLWCPWCHVVTITILCGNFYIIYGVLSIRKSTKKSGQGALDTRSIEKGPTWYRKSSHMATTAHYKFWKSSHIKKKLMGDTFLEGLFLPITYFQNFRFLFNASSYTFFNVRTFSKLIVCSGCHVGTYAILCGTFFNTFLEGLFLPITNFQFFRFLFNLILI